MRFQDLSLKKKLVLLTSAICLVSVVLCAAGLIVNDLRTLRASKVTQCRSVAQMLAFNSTAVVTFRESEAAEALLQALSGESHVEQAALFASDGTLVSRYDVDGTDHKLPQFEMRSDHVFQGDGGWMGESALQIFQPVVEEGEVIGLVYLRSNLWQLRRQTMQNIGVAVSIGLMALLVATLLAMFFQRVISEPVLTLTQTAKAITEDGNYETRVNRTAKDELGILFSAFNKMLGRIEQSEKQLRAYNDDLEDRVSQRTAELEREVKGHRETAQSLIQAKNAAEQASQVKSDFLANMSHEIRTPMNAILGFTELLKRAEESGEAEKDARREYLDTIHSSGQHLLGLINDILDISKIESGKMVVEKIVFSPHQMVSEVVSILRVQAERKGIGLEYSWVGKVPETIESDPARFRQVVINLIGNAIKFTHEGQVDVVLQLCQGADGDPKLKVEVKDSGIGIDEEKLEQIFDPFVQADNSMTRRFGGTGLGLTICKKIVLALGGDLQVESVVDEGSNFSFTLNVGCLDDVEMLDTPQGDFLSTEVTDSEVEESVEGNAIRVLVVEDGLINRKLVTTILTKSGMSVKCAENGKIGAEMALSESFDVVLMDMQMPVMDGYTAARLLREKGYDVPIIALTAHAMSGDREKCLKAGCSDFLTKPISPDRLLTSMSQWLPQATSTVSEDVAETIVFDTPPKKLQSKRATVVE